VGWAGLPAQVRAGLQLPDRLLDRLIGGRAWIAVIAFALIGIVGMQLWVVKLGVGIGRALEHTQLLQQENSTLASEDSSLSSAERIERLALARGMAPAPPSALHFDTLRGPLDARLAAAALSKPIPASTPTVSSTPVGYGAAASTEAGAGTAGTEAGTGTTGTEAGASTTTAEASGAAASGAGAAGAETAASSTSEAAAMTSPASEARGGTTSSATAAPATPAPTSPAEPTEAAGTPVGSGGGVPAPGG
jgi:cell division protein FtsL